MDDGTFTRITFANNRRMPAVYEQDEKGNEHLVNWTVEGDSMIVHRVYRKLVLRKGDAVACLVNKGYS
ncbi:TrbG/VirB9 family P-type conjugative transfer protein, partial [Pseudomonas aeruginosa]